MKIAIFRCLLVAAFGPLIAFSQITISGVTDKATYNSSATFTIGTQAGYDYSATLNWVPVAIGTPVAVEKPDFYELRVDATNQTTSAVTSRYVRFIVLDPARAGTETGLPPHVPFPVIQSSPAEFENARLRLIVPANFPAGYEIPVVCWVIDGDDRAVRANGPLAASGQNSIQLKRGVGSGFLASNQAPGVLNYAPSVGGIGTNKAIQIESATTWTSVSGVLAGTTTWPEQSRIRVTGNLSIPAGSTLEIGAGSVVLLNAGVNITNNGAVNINGTIDQPVIFMPNTRSQPWGGFFMRSSSGSINASGTIFVASGADPNGGAGHRSEQALFLVSNAPSLFLTDSAAIYLAGQMGHAYNGGTFTFTRFLMQRATTGGEYTSASFRVNDSAFIECPDDSVNFVDGDNDALYFVSGTHGFTNTLIGWTKDDGIDSGGSGYGPLTYQSCWFESTFHEGNSLSGYKNVFARDTVYIDCGQGIENGYDRPTSRVDNCFFTMNKSGIRHGDNYSTFSMYDGPFIATNNISIYNHRDLFGFNWDNSNNGGWTNNYERFFASNNLVSALDTNYPNNTLWNPATDAWRLGVFGGVGRVGAGFGVRAGQGNSTALPDGIPVGLSRFSTNEVRVEYRLVATNGAAASGTLVFPAGLTRRYIPFPGNLVGPLDVTLTNPVNADVTSPGIVVTNLPPPPPASPLIVFSPLGANWRYLDDGSEQGTLWRGTNFNDTMWSNGLARLGFGGDASPLTTTIRRYVQQAGTNTTRQVTNFYFRQWFVASNLSDFTSLQFRYQRDDGCIVYVNGRELFRNNMPTGAVNATTFSSTTISGASETLRFWTNFVPVTNFNEGMNLVAVEVHQASGTSSDIAWDLEIGGVLPEETRLKVSRSGGNVLITWPDPSFTLQEADFVDGPWRPAPVTNSPAVLPMNGTRFFRATK